MDESLVKFLRTMNTLLLFPFELKRVADKTEFRYKPYRYLLKFLAIAALITYCQFDICYDKLLRSKSLNELIFVTFTLILDFPHFYSSIHVLIRRNRVKELVQILDFLAKEVDKSSAIPRRGRMRNFLLVETGYLIFISIYLQLIYFVHYDFKTFLLYGFGYTLPKLLIITSSFGFVNFLAAINDFFSRINANLTSTRNEARVRHLLSLYFHLVQTSASLNSLYGWQNLLHIAHYFCWVFYELYHWTVLLFQKEITEGQFFLISYASSWITVQFSTLVCILYFCQLVEVNAHQVVYLWHDFAARNRPTKTVINISINLMVQKVSFTASNWFHMNFALILTIVGTFVTYATIFFGFSRDA